MHMVIRAIVYADDEEEALERAREIFERLTENSRPFDYFKMFDEPGSSVSGRGRWGELPACVEASSKEGKKLIKEGMKYTRDEFMRDVKIVRKALKDRTDLQLFNSRYDKEMVRYRFYCLGQDKGASVWLYDNDGEGIQEGSHLRDVLSKWKTLHKGKENPYLFKRVWVVPADVHF
jgi:hypothetical protein